MVEDILIFPLWFGFNALIFLAGWQWSRRLCPEAGVFYWVCTTILSWWSSIVTVSLLCSIFGLVSGPFLLAGNCIFGFALVSLLCVPESALSCVFRLRDKPISDARLFGTPVVPLEVQAKRYNALSRVLQSNTLWIAFWAMWIAMILARVLICGLLEFPEDWDTLMYHLPLVDQWLRAGSLYAPDDPVWYNPGTSELITLSTVAPFSGDFFYCLQNLPVIILLISSALVLGETLGFSVLSRHLTALALVSNQVVFRQMLDNKNDLAVVALFLACAAFGFRYLSDNNRAYLFYSSIAFGLLCGIKYYAVGYAGVLWLALIVFAVITRQLRAALMVTVLFAFFTLTLAGYWYCRNAYITGTPVYPKGISAGDIVIQLRPNLWKTTLFRNGSPKIPGLVLRILSEKMGLCSLVSFLLLPFTIVAVIICAFFVRRNPKNGLGVAPRLALCGLAVGSCVVIGLTPFTVELVPGTLYFLRNGYLPARFALTFLATTVFCLTLALTDLSSWLVQQHALRKLNYIARFFLSKSGAKLIVGLVAGVPSVFLSVLAGSQFVKTMRDDSLGHRWENVPVFVSFVLAAAIFAVLWKGRTRVECFCLVLFGGATVVGGAWGTDCLANRWHANFAAHYDKKFSVHVFQDLDKKQAKSMRICVLGSRYYPFLGSRRQRSVCRPGYLLSLHNVLHFLRDEKITLVATLDTNKLGKDRYERNGAWLSEYPQFFTPFRGDKLWDVRRDAIEKADLASSARRKVTKNH